MKESTKLKISLATKGRLAHNKGEKNPALFKDCIICKNSFYARSKGDFSRRKTCGWPCFRRYLHEIKSGDKNHFWQGGIGIKNKLIRKTLDYKLWREAVFERDNYTCQICKNRGGTIQADHIKPFAYYPDLRLELSNGRTLCISCHEKTDTYKNKIRWGYSI